MPSALSNASYPSYPSYKSDTSILSILSIQSIKSISQKRPLPYNDTNHSRPAQRKVRASAYLFLVLFGFGVALAYRTLGPDGPKSYEAVVRAGVCRDLMAGLPRGRQGLVGSLRWAPLPTLLALPWATEGGTFGMSVAAAAAAAGLCVFLFSWWTQYGMSRIPAAAAAFALFFSPPLLRPILAGTSETVFAFCIVVMLAHFIHWWETEELRSLAYTAVAGGVAVFVRYQAVAALAFVLALYLVHLVAQRRRESYVEATLITFLMPGAYVIGLWFAANWLIMGDALFFLRGLGGFAGREGLRVALTDGAEWLACLPPALVGVLGWGLGRLNGSRRNYWTGAPVLLACALLWTGGAVGLRPVPAGENAGWLFASADAGAYRSLDPASAELRKEVLPALMRKYAEHRVVVSGYRGYEIRRLLPQPNYMVVHTLSLYLDEAQEDTKGHRLYLLAPRERMGDPQWEDIDRWEDANIRFPRLHTQGARGLIYEKAWRYWSLWMVVRTDVDGE